MHRTISGGLLTAAVIASAGCVKPAGLAPLSDAHPASPDAAVGQLPELGSSLTSLRAAPDGDSPATDAKQDSAMRCGGDHAHHAR